MPSSFLFFSNLCNQLQTTMKLFFFIWVSLLPLISIAEDTPSNYKPTPSWISQSRQAIKSKDYALAIKILNDNSDQRQTADWNNLMGYSHRKMTPPDLIESEKYYQTALEIDPKHKGALEYYGELLLLKNNLDGAESLLKRLDKVCTFGCDEYRDLKKSIQAFKSKK
jgi:tetratricopeptide (TPR) repeat protein